MGRLLSPGNELPRDPLPGFIKVHDRLGSGGRLRFGGGGSPFGSPGLDEVDKPKAMEVRKRSSECQMFHNVPLNGMRFYYAML